MTIKSEVDLFIALVNAAYQTGAINAREAELALTRALASSITGHPDFRAIADKTLPKQPPRYLM